MIWPGQRRSAPLRTDSTSISTVADGIVERHHHQEALWTMTSATGSTPRSRSTRRSSWRADRSVARNGSNVQQGQDEELTLHWPCHWNNGKRTRSTTTHPQREEHAADHQGHEDGLGGQAAPRAGARALGAALRADDHQRPGIASSPRSISTTRRPASAAIRCLMTRPEKNVLLIVVTGDKGFAGAFNANIVKAATQFIARQPRPGDRS